MAIKPLRSPMAQSGRNSATLRADDPPPNLNSTPNPPHPRADWPIAA